MADVEQQFGADRVNDDLEVGYDQRFERSWHKAEIAGRVVIVLVVAAGLAGLFGRGPFSHRTVALPDDSLSADFEPVARSGTPTQVTLHVKPAAGAFPPDTRSVNVTVSSTLVEPLGLQNIEPQPEQESAEHGNLVARIALPRDPVESFVRFNLRPTVVGPIELNARLNDGPTLRWTQVILP